MTNLNMSFDEVVAQIPKEWFWVIEKPRSWAKKKNKKSFTVYIANEHVFGSPDAVSMEVDTDDPLSVLYEALTVLPYRLEKKKDERNEARQKERSRPA